jgi:endoglucanase
VARTSRCAAATGGLGRRLGRQSGGDRAGVGCRFDAWGPEPDDQVAIFRLTPWEQCSGSWSTVSQASYRAWIDSYAAGLGNARVAVILQPDMPFATCVGSSVPEQLVAYAAKVFDALPHTTVYVDAGSYEWDSPSQMAQMLLHSGIRHARGFALDVTQYGSTDDEIQWGAQINHALAYMWLGRPWMINAGPFSLSDGLTLGANALYP